MYRQLNLILQTLKSIGIRAVSDTQATTMWNLGAKHCLHTAVGCPFSLFRGRLLGVAGHLLWTRRRVLEPHGPETVSSQRVTPGSFCCQHCCLCVSVFAVPTWFSLFSTAVVILTLFLVLF